MMNGKLSVSKEDLIMKTIKYFILLITFFAFFAIGIVFAYDNSENVGEGTHPGITKQTLSAFKAQFNFNLTSQDEEWIIQGAHDEDIPGLEDISRFALYCRYLRHFYSPQKGNIGYKNKFSNAKVWATNDVEQKQWANELMAILISEQLNPDLIDLVELINFTPEEKREVHRRFFLVKGQIL